MFRLLLSVIVATLLFVPPIIPLTSASAGDCRFVLGFKAIHDAIPDVVGDCLDNEGYNPLNGDALQHTTAWHSKGGLLVWQKIDNWTAFTDGYRTWVNGPYGVQERLNTDRFRWETDWWLLPQPAPSVAPQHTPEPALDTARPTALCRDGTLSYSAHRQGTRSWHGGVAVWY